MEPSSILASGRRRIIEALYYGVRDGHCRFRKGFSRTFDDVGRARPGSVTTPLHQTALSARARSNTNPARPYICRLIVFNRFT